MSVALAFPDDEPRKSVAEQVAELTAAVAALPEGDPRREQAAPLLQQLRDELENNPLASFEPHAPMEGEAVSPQEEFFAARTPIVAAFAGNRFGKTTGLVVRTIIDCVDSAVLPKRIRQFKTWTEDTAPRGTFARIVCPDFTATAEGVILPAFRRWTPKDQFRGGSFDKAWDKQLRTLRFANGSWVQVMTYEQDLDKFGGAALHVVGYDEPPPQQIREECMARLIDFGGYEMFAMTPLKANTGWIRREVWKKRESPDITVVKGSIHHNSTLDERTKDRFLNGLSSDLWRQAREFGDFVDIGGLIYSDFERSVIDPPSAERVREWDAVVSIDPGIRNAAFIWGGFDHDNTCTVFDELLLQDKTVKDYAHAIRETNKRWGLTNVAYVIDPAARSRAQINAESVETALAREGIYCQHGQNAVEAGIQQVRSRIQFGRLKVSKTCVGIRDEADEYAAEDRADGEFKPVKQNDHRLDALRYLVMSRPWDPIVEQDSVYLDLGQGDAIPFHMRPRRPQEVPPTGAMT